MKNAPDRTIETLKHNQIHVHEFKLDTEEEVRPNLISALSKDELERAARFRFERHRRWWTTSRAQTRITLGAYLNVPADEVKFTLGANGKPELTHPHMQMENGLPLYFNLSHSNHRGLLAVTHTAAIGVDIELVKPLKDWRAIAARFFSTPEQHELSQVPADLRHLGFYQAWTRKESIIKATGEGLSADLQSFSVSLTPGEPAIIHSIACKDNLPTNNLPQHNWQLFHLECQQDYVGAVAIQSEHPQELIRIESY